MPARILISARSGTFYCQKAFRRDRPLRVILSRGDGFLKVTRASDSYRAVSTANRLRMIWRVRLLNPEV
eukprot:4278497-Pyramimonas_sp.AAC.1